MNIIFNKAPQITILFIDYSQRTASTTHIKIRVSIKQGITTIIPDLTSINLNIAERQKHKDSYQKPTTKKRNPKGSKQKTSSSNNFEAYPPRGNIEITKPAKPQKQKIQNFK